MSLKKTDARDNALKVLLRVDTENAYSNIELRNMQAMDMLDKAEDRRLVSMLVYGVIRMKRAIDYLIMQHSSVPLDKMDDIILNILRLGVYQLKYMDRIPDSAACNESVKLAKKNGLTRYSGFVNAVLRNMVRNPVSMELKIPEPLSGDSVLPVDGVLSGELGDGVLSEKYLQEIGVALSYPDWLVRKWVLDYGAAKAISLMKAGNQPADFTIRVNTLKIGRDELIKTLKSEGINSRIGRHSNNSIIIDNIGNSGGVERLKSFKDGMFYVQDESSLIAIENLCPLPGETIIDLCSAPGGKSTYIAELMENKGVIHSGDLHSGRLKLVNESASRLGISNIKTQIWDAAILNPIFKNIADKVLIDAPCSGLGVIRRKPEIKWTSSRSAISSLAEIQLQILIIGAEYVKSGGQLMYSTCTLSEEENGHVVQNFLKRRSDYKYEASKTLFMDTDNTDGFFFAKFIRL